MLRRKNARWRRHTYYCNGSRVSFCICSTSSSASCRRASICVWRRASSDSDAAHCLLRPFPVPPPPLPCRLQAESKKALLPRGNRATPQQLTANISSVKKSRALNETPSQSYGIYHLPLWDHTFTQCYLPPVTPPPQPPKVGTRFTYPGGMEGWVDQVTG